MAIFACEPASALDAMESVKQNRIVPRPNPNTLADGLRTSLGELTLPMLRRHGTGFFAGEKRKLDRQCNSPMSDSRW
jgi:threonine dehydratase